MTAARAGRHRMPGRLVVGGVAGLAVAAVALVVALVATGALPGERLDAVGAVVAWLRPLLRLVSTLAAVGCIGALLAAVVLLRTDGGPLGSQGRRAVRDAANSAVVWAVASFAGVFVTTAVLLDTPLRLLRYRVEPGLALPEVRALLVTGVLATVLAVVTRWVRTASVARFALLAAVVALVPPVLTTYPRDEAYVVPAGAGLVVHVLAATTWIGGLAGLVRYGRASRTGLPWVLGRYHQVALVSSVVLVLGGLVSAVARLAAREGGFGDGLVSAYGALLLAKLVLLILVLVAGVLRGRRLRQRTAPDRGFWQWVVAELVLLAALFGVSGALTGAV